MPVLRMALPTVLLAVGLVAAACGGSEEGGTISLDGESANDHGTEDVSGETALELELDDFYFAPTVLTGTAGQELALELTNEGGEEHNFSLPDQTIDQDVEPDGSAQVTVTFPDSGTLVFICKYHDGQGMRGALQTE
jgi:plastocyanin